MRKGDSEPLPPHLQQEVNRLEARLDEPVDTSDTPEITDWSRGIRRRFLNKRKQSISVSLDADLVEYVEQARQGSLDDRLNTLLREWTGRVKQAAE